jgi:hypothetical protein
MLFSMAWVLILSLYLGTMLHLSHKAAVVTATVTLITITITKSAAADLKTQADLRLPGGMPTFISHFPLVCFTIKSLIHLEIYLTRMLSRTTYT